MSAKLMPGDVFTARLTDGRLKAVRVLRTVGKSSLVCTTAYLEVNRPNLDEPLLRKTVVQNRFSWRGTPAMKWLQGKPPAIFEFLGNLPLTLEEVAMECNVYGGKWDQSSGDEAFLEWRWLHDRPAFESEIRDRKEQAELRRSLPQTPKEMMSEEEFWPIIDLLDWTHQGSDKKVLAPARDSLAAKSTEDICRFEERLAFLLYQLDTKAHARNIGKYSFNPKSGHVSADGFLYARCVVVANGSRFYESVLKDPTKMPKDMEFERLLYLAAEAYALKTGEDLEYSTGCSFESFSNHAGWQSSADAKPPEAT